MTDFANNCVRESPDDDEHLIVISNDPTKKINSSEEFYLQGPHIPISYRIPYKAIKSIARDLRFQLTEGMIVYGNPEYCISKTANFTLGNSSGNTVYDGAFKLQAGDSSNAVRCSIYGYRNKLFDQKESVTGETTSYGISVVIVFRYSSYPSAKCRILVKNYQYCVLDQSVYYLFANNFGLVSESNGEYKICEHSNKEEYQLWLSSDYLKADFLSSYVQTMEKLGKFIFPYPADEPIPDTYTKPVNIKEAIEKVPNEEKKMTINPELPKVEEPKIEQVKPPVVINLPLFSMTYLMNTIDNYQNEFSYRKVCDHYDIETTNEEITVKFSVKGCVNFFSFLVHIRVIFKFGNDPYMEILAFINDSTESVQHTQPLSKNNGIITGKEYTDILAFITEATQNFIVE